MSKMSFSICATLKERLGRKGEDSQTDTGKISPGKHFPAGCTETEFALRSVYIMISLAAAAEGDYAGQYQQNSFSAEVGMSCNFSRGLQVDGEQEWVQELQGRKREELSIDAMWVLPEKLIDTVVARTTYSATVTYASQWQIMVDCAWKLQKCWVAWAGRWGSYPLPSKYHLLVLLTV